MILKITTVLILAQTVYSTYLGKTDEGINIFSINLNDKPIDRFRETTRFYKDDLLTLMQLYKNELPLVDYFMYIFKFLDVIQSLRNSEYHQELNGIAQELGVKTYDTLMTNYLYELDAFCTSIVFRMANGTIGLHRNLDFAFQNETRRILYIGKFYKGNKLIFEAPMFAGMVAVFTGHVPGGFGLSINERASKDRNPLNALKNIALIVAGSKQVALLTRETLTQCQDYTCALKKLQTESLIAGVYYILAGTRDNEGAVISRDQKQVLNVRTLSEDAWYLVQTNQDHFAGDCPIRCQQAHINMERMGKVNIDRNIIFENVMKVWPTLNYQAIHNTQIVPGEGYSVTNYIYAYDNTDPGDL